MNNITYNDFKIICRMCMLNCDVKFSQDSVISSVFHKLTDLHFETNNDLPKQICRNCFEKINEIHEFMLQCKRTHSALMECLNNQQNVMQNKNIEKIYELPIILDKNVTIEQQTTEFVENNGLISSDVNLNNFEVEIKKEIREDTNYKLNNDIIPETIEIKEDEIENANLQETCSNLTEEITLEEHKIEFVKDEHVIDEKTEINIDQILNKDTDSSDCSNTLDLSSEMNKNEDKVYRCGVCYRTFIYFNVFKQHKSLPDCERPFKCDQCSKWFTDLSNLCKHRNTHIECPFKCDQCSKSFPSSFRLKAHVRTHSGERPFKCDKCSKSFGRLYDLKEHVCMDSRLRPFKCVQCPKSYTSLSNLYTHRRIHNGGRHVKCEQCSKSFNYLCNLKTHMRTHSGERPFECDECSKSFSQLINMKVHMFTHTGERPFKCDHCSKWFSRLDNMKNHMRMHSGERPLEC